MLTQPHQTEPADAAATPAGWRSSWGYVGWVVIAIVFAIGCWIRFRIATGELLWLDELHTGWAVGGSFQQMLTRSAQGNQAPLFFGLEWLVVQWFGPSELSLRLVSLIAGALAMAMAARFVWWYTGSIAAAAVTLTLIALNQNFIWYSSEARPYALLHLASVLQVGCLWRMVTHWQSFEYFRRCDEYSGEGTFNYSTRNDSFGIFWLLLSSWLVVYTHYTGVFLLATELLFLSVLLICWWLTRGLTKGTVKQVFVILFLFVVGCLPLLLQMNQAFGKPADWSSVASLVQFWTEQKVNCIVWFGIPIAVALLSVGLIAPFVRNDVFALQPHRWLTALWLSWIATWFAVPLLIIVFLQSQAGIPIALSRYMSVALIAGPVFVGGIVGVVSVRSRWIAIPIIFLASLFLQVQGNHLVVQIVRSGQLPLLRTENWKAAIEVVNESPSKAKWPLFLFGAVIEDENALSDAEAEVSIVLAVSGAWFVRT